MNDINELSLKQIDDYYNQESNKKRRTVYFTIITLLLFGVVFSFVKPSNYSYSSFLGYDNQHNHSSTVNKTIKSIN
jgi:hypothetical protein